MKIFKFNLLHAILTTTLLTFSINLKADNGFYPLSFGAKSKAMGGAAVAYAQDTLCTLINPAGLSDIGNRLDAAGGWIYHTQKVEISNISAPLMATGLLPATYPINGSRNVVFGEGGRSMQLTDSITGALLLTGQSGGIFRFQSPHPKVFDIGTHKVEKVFYAALTPIVSYQFCDHHSFGLGIDLTGAIVDFHNFHDLAAGILNTSKIINGSAHPHHVTNKGWDFAWGAAGRFGYLCHVNDCLAIGLSYRTKTFMGRFRKYEGIISPQGRSDLPAVLTAGFSVRMNPRTVFAFDYSRIYFQDVPAFGNKVFLATVTSFDPFVVVGLNPHGANNGAGFGFKSRNVYKLGFQYDFSECLALRAGYNYGKSPVSRKVGEPYLPLVVEHHLTLGSSWELSTCSELSFVWIHGFKKKLRTHPQKLLPEVANRFFQTTKINLDLTAQIDQIELQYSKVF